MGQLMQEREWAYGEIMRLREEIARLTQRNSPGTIEAQPMSPVPMANTDPMLHKHRLIRLPEARRLVGTSRSSIYRLVSEGRFRVPLGISERAVQWWCADFLHWQAHAAEGS